VPKSSIATVASSAFSASNTRVARAGSWTIELSVSSSVSRRRQAARFERAFDQLAISSRRPGSPTD
jgi:hypothetical protein